MDDENLFVCFRRRAATGFLECARIIYLSVDPYQHSAAVLAVYVIAPCTETPAPSAYGPILGFRKARRYRNQRKIAFGKFLLRAGHYGTVMTPASLGQRNLPWLSRRAASTAGEIDAGCTCPPIVRWTRDSYAAASSSSCHDWSLTRHRRAPLTFATNCAAWMRELLR